MYTAISKLKKILALVGFLGLAAIGPQAHADGTETLGSPSIPIATGSGIAAAGVGLVLAQPDTIEVSVPAGATVKQVLIYWEGQSSGPSGDDTIIVNGNMVNGTLIGGPTNFFGSIYSSSYRADITGLGFVSPGNNLLAVEGLTFDHRNNGAGVLVIYDTGPNSVIQVRDGNDLAFIDFAGPLQTTASQTFNFAPAAIDRMGTLSMFFSSVSGTSSSGGVLRPTAIDITVNGTTTTVNNQLSSVDGEQWDTLIVPVTIPAGASSVKVKALSEDRLGTGELPASFAWTAAALSVPRPAPAIDIEKATNGQDADNAPGPFIPVGDPVNWTYVVTNTGPVPLTNVVVTDDKGVAVSCPKTQLAPAESMTCTASGTATAGQYENTGAVCGVGSGLPVCDEDPSHYFGEQAGAGQGCTPGYWKQAQHFASWTVPYSPSTPFNAVFDNAFPGKTLLQVLQQGGGGLIALGRHTVAALLNAASANVSYDLTPSQIIAAFNAAFPGGNYEQLKNRFEGFNEQGCPLNGDRE